MKYKLLSVRGKDATNIGDYVQALASSQFQPSIDGFINREELSSYDGEESCVIMNGWFMHNPLHWPPSEKIRPLFVAFHLNSSVADEMLSDAGVQYLKRFEPIGCRDTNTVRLLTQKGVSAYFSGCMTLTLGNKYYDNHDDGTVYFVDPIIPKSRNPIELCKNLFFYILSIRDVNKVSRKLYQGSVISFKRKIISAGFLRLYSRWFERKLIVDAVYLSQENKYYKENFVSDIERLNEAERLVRLYARARLVVTKRIHCALPCLGLETPVVFLTDKNDDEVSTCRFGGLIDFFNVMECSTNKLTPRFELPNMIGLNNLPRNRNTWRDYSSKLTTLCRVFINKANNNE